MSNVLIFGYLGYGNLGDETNLEQLLNLVRAIDAQAKITVISASPRTTSEDYRVTAINKYNLFKIIAALSKADFLIGNGGSLFQDITSQRSLYYYCGLVILAKLLKARVFLYGQGIGPLRSRLGRALAGRVLSLADVITVRDRLSIVALAELNVWKPEIHFTAEPLLALKSLPEADVRKYWGSLEIKRRIKLGLIFQEYGSIKKDFWGQFISYLSRESNVEIYLIPVQERDRGILQEFSANYQLALLQSAAGWQQLQQAAGGLDLLVSSRLHGLVAGVLQGIPCYGLAADPKVEGFCWQLGIPFLWLTLETDPLTICDKIKEFMARPPEERPAYLTKLAFWKARALENQIVLRQFLQKNYE